MPLAKVCWSCNHMMFSNSDPGYSSWTPGWNFSMGCGKGYWVFDSDGDYVEAFRGKLLTAENCKDFEEREYEDQH